MGAHVRERTGAKLLDARYDRVGELFVVNTARLRFVFYPFFFSSRRRHTRFDCDWSSDVCSSDLVVHPLAGQGVNLGLADAAALAQLVLAATAAREDPGAFGVLRAYERWRRSEVALMSTAIDAFDRWLAHGSGPVARAAQHRLAWVNRSQELRRFFIRRALGTSGEPPSAAHLRGSGEH